MLRGDSRGIASEHGGGIDSDDGTDAGVGIGFGFVDEAEPDGGSATGGESGDEDSGG